MCNKNFMDELKEMNKQFEEGLQELNHHEKNIVDAIKENIRIDVRRNGFSRGKYSDHIFPDEQVLRFVSISKITKHLQSEGLNIEIYLKDVSHPVDLLSPLLSSVNLVLRHSLRLEFTVYYTDEAMKKGERL